MNKKNGISILYVEDEDNVREMLSRFISRFCETLYVAGDGEMGLELYQEHKIDIVISDIKMPRMNGLDMAQHIKKINPKQLLVFLTAHSDSDFLFDAINLQVDGYLVKPIDLDILADKLEKLINISQNQKILDRLHKSEERLMLLAQAVEQMDEMVKITKKDGKIIYVNQAVVNHSGYSTEELIGSDNSIFKSSKHPPEFYQNLWETILKGETYSSVIINKKKNGKLYHEEQTITSIYDDEGNIKYFVSTGKDITQRMEMLEELRTLAIFDSLTEIYNRYKINLKIDDEIARANRYDETFALIMFDIDHFKNINDTYGHDVGDSVLKELAKIIKSTIRDSDKFGRWGGEEFMLIATKIDEENAIKLADKLRKVVEEFDFTYVNHITVSVGVTLFKKGCDKTKTLKRVDDALYKSKNNGRNVVTFL